MLLPLVLKQLLVEDCWFVQNANALIHLRKHKFQSTLLEIKRVRRVSLTHYFTLISAVLNDPIFLRFTQYIRKDSTYDLLPFCLGT